MTKEQLRAKSVELALARFNGKDHTIEQLLEAAEKIMSFLSKETV